MSGHVHLIISAKQSSVLLDIMRDFKKFTSKKTVAAVKENPQENRKDWLLEEFITNDGISFWGTDNHPVELWSNSVINQKLDYLLLLSGKNVGYIMSPLYLCHMT
ncbi:MAG: hypothetical protein ACYC2P_11250 [Paludibacteraceae bacterium]